MCGLRGYSLQNVTVVFRLQWTAVWSRGKLQHVIMSFSSFKYAVTLSKDQERDEYWCELLSACALHLQSLAPSCFYLAPFFPWLFSRSEWSSDSSGGDPQPQPLLTRYWEVRLMHIWHFLSSNHTHTCWRTLMCTFRHVCPCTVFV